NRAGRRARSLECDPPVERRRENDKNPKRKQPRPPKRPSRKARKNTYRERPRAGRERAQRMWAQYQSGELRFEPALRRGRAAHFTAVATRDYPRGAVRQEDFDGLVRRLGQ